MRAAKQDRICGSALHLRAGDTSRGTSPTKTLGLMQGLVTLMVVVDTTCLGELSTRRMIQWLVQIGHLRHGVPGEFRLKPTLIEFGFTSLNQNPLPVVARQSL